MSVLRSLFYSKSGNRIARSLAYPFRSLVPTHLQFPIHGTLPVSIPGAKLFYLQVNPTCFLGKILFWKGADEFESGMHRVFQHLIQEADTFLDVGANIGFYSLYAHSCNPSVRVHGFEPLPAAFRFLERNIELNSAKSRVSAHQVALSDKSRSSTFHFALNPKFLFLKEQLTSTGSLDRDQAETSTLLEQIEIEQVTMDQFMEGAAECAVDLIKLDTEATEHLVLDGAVGTLQTHRPFVLCEVLAGKVERAIEERITAYDYMLFSISDRGLVPLEHLRHDKGTTNDHLFCPIEKSDRIQELLAASGPDRGV